MLSLVSLFQVVASRLLRYKSMKQIKFIQNKIETDADLKKFKSASSPKQAYVNNQHISATKHFEQPFIRRRYSFDNSTGAGYQGL